MEQEGNLARSWEAAAFDRDKGEWVHTELHSYDHTQSDIDIRELLVRQAPPTRITPSRRKAPSRRDQLTIVAGDAQIPFHDPAAIEAFQQEVANDQPDNIVLVGDMLDLPTLSRFQPRPEWLGRTQESIDYFHTFLAQLRSNAPNSNIYAVHGNHEARLDNYVNRNAQEVLGLRRANAGHELSVLSLRYLVRYSELDISAIDGYPNGTLWLEDNLKFKHGTNVAKGGSNAAKYLREERETTIYGHTHRQELAYRTFPQRLGSVTIAAASPGCLALTDGSVPGFNHTVDAEGQVVRRAEDWQAGWIKIEHKGDRHKIMPELFMPE